MLHSTIVSKTETTTDDFQWFCSLTKSHIDCQARLCQFGLSDMIFGVIFVHLIIKCLHDCFIIV